MLCICCKNNKEIMENKAMTNIKFSIIMPAYNAERYIGQAIESVLNQNYNKWELIVRPKL